MIFSLLDAAKYSVVHDFKGGAVALAPLVNMNSLTLSNKVNPNQETHHLTVDEAVAIQNTAKDYRILNAEAALLGHVCIPLRDFAGVSDLELLNAYAAWHADVGETAFAINRALEDGKVTRAALNEVKREIHEDVQRAFEFYARLEALCDE